MPKARRTDPSESHDAARSITQARRRQLRMTVLNTLRDAGGPLSTKEIAELTGIPRDSLSPRMPSLVADGFVQRTGQRRAGAALFEPVRK